MVVPALYTFQGPSVLIGWTIHLFHGAVLGALFARLVTTETIAQRISSFKHWVTTGLIYGMMVWAIGSVIVLPLWLRFVGFGGAPRFPNFVLLGIFGHLIYGVLLSIVLWHRKHAILEPNPALGDNE
jgi:hypothetical protein